MPAEPHVIREKSGEIGQVTIPSAYKPHVNVRQLTELVKEAANRIPEGEIPVNVIVRVHNAKTVENLLDLLKNNPVKRRLGW